MKLPAQIRRMLTATAFPFWTLILLFARQTSGEGEDGLPVSLNDGNKDNILATNEIVFVNFYADWCRFSQILGPVFEETSKKIKELYPTPGKVIFAKVDCDKESGIAGEYQISKYPTLKLFRNGQIVKKEYRGQRSVSAFVEYIEGQAKDVIKKHTSMDEIDELEDKKRNVIGYFADEHTDAYNTYKRVASQLRDDCQFHAAIGEIAESERSSGDKLTFRPPNTRREDQVYQGEISNFEFVLKWCQDKCVPLVREITFENAEELTEEGLPFLILFHKPDDTDITERFTKAVIEQLLMSKNNINFLTADGLKFSHPLHHLGKSTNDLPVLAIDSFRHMYLFKHDVRLDIDKPGLLKQFVDDLHSGKLHREFHHGPDPTTMATPPDPNVMQDSVKSDTAPQTDDTNTQQADSKQDAVPQEKHIPHDPTPQKQQQPSSPPESTFKKLLPSETRYTFLNEKDEL